MAPALELLQSVCISLSLVYLQIPVNISEVHAIPVVDAALPIYWCIVQFDFFTLGFGR